MARGKKGLTAQEDPSLRIPPQWIDRESGELLAKCPAWMYLPGVQVVDALGCAYRVVVSDDIYPEDGGATFANLNDAGRPYIPNPMDAGTQGVLHALLRANGLTAPIAAAGPSLEDSARQWGQSLTRALVGAPRAEIPGWSLVATVSHSNWDAITAALSRDAEVSTGRYLLFWATPGHVEVLVQNRTGPDAPTYLTAELANRVFAALQRLPATGYRAPLVTRTLP